MSEPSRRKRLLEFAETGKLRDALSNGRIDQEVIDLIVDLCIRYSEPRRKRRKP